MVTKRKTTKRKTTARAAQVPRKRGAGFGDFISNTLGGIGGGIGGGVNKLFGSLFGGRKVRRRRRGGELESGIPQAPPLPAEPSFLQKLNKLAKDTKLVSKGLNAFGQNTLGGMAGKLGYGRKRKRRGTGNNLKLHVLPDRFTGSDISDLRLLGGRRRGGAGSAGTNNITF